MKVTLELDDTLEQFLVARQRYLIIQGTRANSLQELLGKCILGNFRIMSERRAGRSSANLDLLMKKWQNDVAVEHLTRAMCLGKGAFTPLSSLNLEAVEAAYSPHELKSLEIDQANTEDCADQRVSLSSPPLPPALKRQS